MDVMEKIRADLLTIETRFHGQEDGHKKQLKRQREQADRVHDQLRSTVAGLQAQVATLDHILAENLRLRAALVTQLGLQQSSNGADTVPIGTFKALQDRVGRYGKQLELANMMGAKYKAECTVLHEKRQRDKKSIKTWQDYHDRLLSKKQQAHHDLPALLDVIESPPAMQPVDDYANDILSSGLPSIASPARPSTRGSMAPSCESMTVHGRPDYRLPQTNEANAKSSSFKVVNNLEADIMQSFHPVTVDDIGRTEPQQAQEMLASSPPQTDVRQVDDESIESGHGEEHVPSSDHELHPIGLPQSREDKGDNVSSGENQSGRAAYNLEQVKQDDEHVRDEGSRELDHGEHIQDEQSEQTPKKRKQLGSLARPPVINSSQSTEAEAEITISPLKKQKHPSSDNDEPQVRFVRPVKRKRMASSKPAPLVRGDGVIHIKDEGGSSPMHQSVYNRMNNPESLDLDAVPAAHITPRKARRSLEANYGNAPPVPALREERSNSLPPHLECKLSNDPDRTVTERSSALHEQDDSVDGAIPEVRRLGSGQQGITEDASLEVGRCEFAIDPSHPAPLRGLDVNQPVAPRSAHPIRKAVQRRRGGRGNINELTEDGDQYSRPRSKHSGVSTGTPSDGKGPLKRLSTMLEHTSSPARKVLTPGLRSDALQTRLDGTYEPRSGQQDEAAITNRRLSAQRDTKRESPMAKHKSLLDKLDIIGELISAGNIQTPPARASSSKDIPPHLGKLKTPMQRTNIAASTTPTPLRYTPITTLIPTDFRINPNVNHGHGHAFTDVVRKTDARRCLSGCTNPTCCGTHFRKMLEIGGVPHKPTKGIFDPSSSQEDPDEQLLREYMGHNAAVLASMSKQQREEALMKARTEQLAGKVGRHKAQWARPRTPPGFWRADFPTTQEMKGDVDEAGRRERELVEERRREAMREGGRWRFADE